jgi:hypothetical protein
VPTGLDSTAGAYVSGFISYDIIADIKMVADKGINVVRVSIATDLLDSWSKGQYPMSTDTSYNNPY